LDHPIYYRPYSETGLGPDLQRILRATYELLIISGAYDKLAINL